jgi:hypothetical protein
MPLNEPKDCIKGHAKYPLIPPSPPESEEGERVRKKSGVKMEFSADEFLWGFPGIFGGARA